MEEGLWPTNPPFLPDSIRSLEDAVLWYRHQFDRPNENTANECNHPSNPNTLRGEVSPNYSVHPMAPERVYALIPDVKLILLLRDPISRAKSSFNMKWQIEVCGDKAWTRADCFTLVNRTRQELADDWQRQAVREFQKEMARLRGCFPDSKDDQSDDSSGYQKCLGLREMSSVELHLFLDDAFHLGRGLYAEQLMQWFKFFSPSQFLILSSEEFERDPESTLKRSTKFLGLDSSLLDTSVLNYRHHVRDYVFQGDLGDINAMLRDFYRPHNERLFRLLESHGHAYAVNDLKKHFVT